MFEVIEQALKEAMERGEIPVSPRPEDGGTRFFTALGRHKTIARPPAALERAGFMRFKWSTAPANAGL